MTSGRMHVAVVGAGAFGGWTALQLLRKGARVTLLDAWGPGNSRASSGGETRILRAVYGQSRIYVKWAARSLKLWQENQERWHQKVFFPIGVLWFVQEKDDFETSSLPFLDAEGLRYEKLTVHQASKQYPQIDFQGVRWVLHEKDAGYLLAGRSCQAVLQSFLSEGGEYRTAQASPGAIASGRMESIELQDGSKLNADQYVFACGPWLGKLFPDLHENLIRPTRQEVFFLGVPAGDTRFTDAALPVWVDHRPSLVYGIPGNEYRGFKIADDARGEVLDPTSDQRLVSKEGLEAMRKFLARRFPRMKDAPLVESRVCQYEDTPDGHFVIDRHPEAGNVWIVGGGSGHGFKHGPVLGEYTASLIHDAAPIDPFFKLSRFSKKES
ncbi:MAG TPA: FAD-dependent oxidoreductase [Acidobacteriota bacterium]|nr:FAD-dependent oxidoreductase [Acidobacteriota bacterium]